MNFNPQAVLCSSPTSYWGEISGAAGKERVDAYRKQNSGKYDVYETELTLRNIAQTVDIPLTNRGGILTQEQLCKLLVLADFQVKPTAKLDALDFCEFLQTQVQALGSGQPDALFLQAQQEFEHCATDLLLDVQRQVYSDCKVRSISNPVKCLSLATRRDGVFVWPDWKNARYVNLVLSCSPSEKEKVKDIAFDWAERKHLRINPKFEF